MAASEAIEVVQDTPRINLVNTIHSGDTSYKRTIVVAVDDSKFSQFAIEWATEHFLARDTDLVVLLNVRPRISAHAGNIVFSDKAEAANADASRKILTMYADLLHEKNFACKAVGLVGNTKTELVREAQVLKADTIIIGSRGSNPVSKALLGSVSDYVMHHAHCPVLVARPSAEERKNWDVGGVPPISRQQI